MIKIRRRKLSIPVSAMSDIAFLLLIFLMVTSLTSSKKSVRISLPEVVRADKINVKKRVHIYIAKDGRLFLNEKRMELSELKNYLETRTALNKNAVIFIYADSEAEYSVIDSVISILKENSLRNCVFATKSAPSAKT